MNIVAIIQARLGSTRLPGKVLMNIQGRSMLSHVIERARRILPQPAVVVTVPAEDANRLATVIDDAGAILHVSSLPVDDVLGRFTQAAQHLDADVVVRLTADCPCLDPAFSSEVLRRYLSYDGIDGLADNVAPNTDGFDTEVFSAAQLLLAHLSATDPADREHVVSWIRRHATLLRVPADGDCPKMSVDTHEDLERVRQVYRAFWKPVFSRDEIREVLSSGDLVKQALG